jgi:hypothetical protein
MNVRIELPARNDLVEGYQFYEENEAGLGDYFCHVSSQTSNLFGYSVGFTERSIALCIEHYLASFRSRFIIRLIKGMLS